MTSEIIKIRGEEAIQAARDLVWEFFDGIKARYPDMVDVVEAYIEKQDVAGELDRFEQVFLPPYGEAFMAVHDGEPVGMVFMKPHGDNDGEMKRMYVRDSARGLGLGRKLGEALVTEARALGYGTIWLDALYRHVEALPLYESLGFERYDDPDAFGGEDERVIHMKLHLT